MAWAVGLVVPDQDAVEDVASVLATLSPLVEDPEDFVALLGQAGEAGARMRVLFDGPEAFSGCLGPDEGAEVAPMPVQAEGIELGLFP